MKYPQTKNMMKHFFSGFGLSKVSGIDPIS